MFDFYRVSAAIPDIKVADIAYNKTQMLSKINEAVKEKANVVVFPELSLTGYTCGDLFLQQTLWDGVKSAISDIIKQTKSLDVIIIFGAPLSVSNQLYNCAITMYHGIICGVTTKTFLPNCNEFYEKRWFSSAKELACTQIVASDICITDEDYIVPIGNDLVFNIPNKFKFGVEICEDVWAPVTPSQFMALSGASLILNLSASNDTIGKREYRHALVKGKSASLNCAYVYVSSGTGESSTDLVFSGHTIFAENGRIVKENKTITDNDYLLTGDFDFGKIKSDRAKGKTFADAYSVYGKAFPQRELCIRDTKQISSSDATFYSISATPFIPSDENKRLTRCKNIFGMQVSGLAKRLLVTGSKLVVGVSGGMDSTLTLLVCAQTLKKLNRPMTDLVGITMPAYGTTDRTYNNAMQLMKTLQITIETIPIKDACEIHYRDIGHDMNQKDVTFENVQARERTQVLMDYANKINAIVVGTGDLSELALGWCTYNADQMSMYGVNSSIPKTLVKWLIDSVVKYNVFPNSSEVLKDIIDTPISPELLPPDKNGNITQKTEDVVGPYELHDFYLYYMMRFGYTPEKIMFLAQIAFRDKYDKETIKKWMKLFYHRFFTQQFKRSCMPDGVKVGSVCLSPRGDWRMPSDASFALWMDAVDKL